MDEKLYNTLTEERDKFPDLLHKINDYRKMSNIIKKLEKKKDINIWYKLCYGLIGKVNNKYSVIYEIPTKQLINSIALIAQLYDIKQIDEVGAGLGLVSNLLQKKFIEDEYKVDITASDNYTFNETSLSLDYVDIIKKDMTDIVWQHKNNIYPSDMVLCFHPLKKSMYNELIEMINSNYIKIIVVVSNIRTNELIFTEDKINIIKDNYDIINLPIYQINYLDIFENNNIKDLYTHSITKIFIKKDINKLSNEDIYDLVKENLYNYTKIDKKRIILQEYALQKLVPFWVSSDKYINEIEMIYNIFIYNKYIPLYIPNIKLLIFWFIQSQLNIFPLKISTKERLISYYEMFTEKKNIPEWIPPYLVNSYIWLYYSEDNIDNLSVDDIVKKIILLYFKNTLC